MFAAGTDVPLMSNYLRTGHSPTGGAGYCVSSFAVLDRFALAGRVLPLDLMPRSPAGRVLPLDHLSTII